MNTTLNKTSQYYRCVGTLSEMNLKREPTKITLKENGKEVGTANGERIMGNIAVETEHGVHTFNVYAQNLTAKGEEAKQWKMYCDMLDWNPKIGGKSGEEPTLVNVEGTVEINDYVGQDGKVKSGLRWRIGRANTKVNPDDPTGTTLKATLFVAGMKEEVRNEEETGRLIVTLYGANNNGACFPIEAIVDEEMADDFTNSYEVGMTVPLEIELVSRHIGGNKGGKKKFGRSSDVSVNNGFDIQELIIVGGENEIEEPDELTTEDEDGNEVEVKTQWINPKAMKLAIKERNNMLEALEKAGYQPKTKTANTTKNSLAEAKKASKVGKVSHPVDDVPFDIDDDFDF